MKFSKVSVAVSVFCFAVSVFAAQEDARFGKVQISGAPNSSFTVISGGNSITNVIDSAGTMTFRGTNNQVGVWQRNGTNITVSAAQINAGAGDYATYAKFASNVVATATITPSNVVVSATQTNSGAVAFGSTLVVGGATTCQSTLAVTGQATLTAAPRLNATAATASTKSATITNAPAALLSEGQPFWVPIQYGTNTCYMPVWQY